MKTSSYLVYNFFTNLFAWTNKAREKNKIFTLCMKIIPWHFANSPPRLNTYIIVCSISLTLFLEIYLASRATFHFIDSQLFVSKSIIHLFRRGTIFRFRHFTNCFLPLKNLLRIPHCVIRKQPPQKQDGKGTTLYSHK